MAAKTVRKIVRIDEEKCNGCGACTTKCTEGALQLIDGKAKLISENYCDGLGACLGECPVGAIVVEERTAENFDKTATEYHMHEIGHQGNEKLECDCLSNKVREFEKSGVALSGCPGSRMIQFTDETTVETPGKKGAQTSALCHWPVQLTLVPTHAPFLQDADVLLTAHCVPFAYAGFHEDFLKDHALLIACPKLDDAESHLEKLTAILRDSDINSLKVLRMEVPCCGGLVYIAKKAIADSGKQIPVEEIIIGVNGDLKNSKNI
jgi:NAD-dependent dihydropyrimidine dehydrogenase PreA subunit